MTNRTCLIDGCNRDARSGDRCHSHYEHRRRTGVDRGPFPETFEDRFWEKVASPRASNECWLWQAATDGGGRYGGMFHNGRVERAHRISYEMAFGPIAAGMVIDHLCRTTLCVNPTHLEAVTQRINVMRGDGIAAINVAKTHCKQGHEFTSENTIQMKSGGRKCRACADQYNIDRRAAYVPRWLRIADHAVNDATTSTARV